MDKNKIDLLWAFKTAKQNNSKTVEIPNTVKFLDVSFGRMCIEYGIENIEFEQGSQLQEIQENACRSCKNIKSVNFENCTNLLVIGNCAFRGSTNLEKVEFPENNKIKKIQDGAFAETGIKNVNLRNSELNKIGDYAFWGCPNLEVLDISNCKELEVVGCAITNDSEKVRLWDLSGCSKIKEFGGNATTAKVFRVNANLEGKPSTSFSQIMLDGVAELWDKDKKLVEFRVSDEYLPEPNMDVLRLTYTGFFKYSRRLGSDISCILINNTYTKKELDFLCKNHNKIYKVLKEIDSDRIGVCYTLLRELGFFDPKVISYKNSSKNEVEQYRVLLAKDMIYQKMLKGAETIQFENEEKRQEFFDEVTKQAQYIAQNPNRYTTSELVYAFVKNNIINNPAKQELLNVFRGNVFKGINNGQEINLKFATFFVQNFQEIVNKKLVEANLDYGEDYCKETTLGDIYNNFDSLLERSNKMLVTRKINQRFGLDDCDMSKKYDNVLEGNEELARQCSYAHLDQDGFDWAQKIFEEGKKINMNKF